MVPFVMRRDGVTLTSSPSTSRCRRSRWSRTWSCCSSAARRAPADDLIEADWEGGVVRIGNAEPISRPLRLTSEEAVVLLLGLRLLADVPGPHDRAAVTSAATPCRR
jgi:proteasome accessory factor C